MSFSPNPDTRHDLPEVEAVALPLPGTPGELLRGARESAGLTVGDIAARLRMGVIQVTALEAADYAALPTGTFLRGFVRSYAKQVRLDPEQAIALLESSHTHMAAVAAEVIVAPTQNIKLTRGEQEATINRTRLVVVVLVTLVVLGIGSYWWIYVRPYRGEGGRPPPLRVLTVPDPAPVLPSPASDGNAAVIAAPDSAITAPLTTTETLNTAIAEPAPASKPLRVPTANEGVLGFTFRGDSWVEVVDATGKTVLSRRFAAGETGEVVARVPLSILIGNAPVTRMAYNGQEFDLAPHTRVAVARVTVK